MRLIDADALRRKFAGGDDYKSIAESMYDEIFVGAIDMEPTVNPYEWISVKDRLPECRLVRDIFNRPSEYISDLVLVCVKSSECDGVSYYVSTDIRRGRTLEDLHWMMSCGYGGSAVYSQEITHWMPLPEPPAENNK